MSPSIARTNEARKAVVRDRRNAACLRPMTPLMRLGLWVYQHQHSIQDAPPDLLLYALGSVSARQDTPNANHESSRARQTQRWLARWRALIERELDRQGSAIVGEAVH